MYIPSAPSEPPPNATAKMTSMRTILAILLQKPYKPINWRNVMGPPLKARPAMLELCLDRRQSVSNSWPAHVGYPGKAQKRVRGGMPATRPESADQPPPPKTNEQPPATRESGHFADLELRAGRRRIDDSIYDCPIDLRRVVTAQCETHIERVGSSADSGGAVEVQRR